MKNIATMIPSYGHSLDFSNYVFAIPRLDFDLAASKPTDRSGQPVTRTQSLAKENKKRERTQPLQGGGTM